ncbi:MAG: M23 family peptidase [Proteobacteria bacterium]|nr:M23 family peptidase [Pseudomonadota bacterium]
MRRRVLVGAALLAALGAFSTAAAAEIEPPKVTISPVDWTAAAAALKDVGGGGAVDAFARLNAVTGKRFPGIAKSSVPVLAPFDLEAFKADNADATPDKYFGPFHPTKYFLPGPAGYTGTYVLDIGGGPFKVSYKKKPVEIEITGAGFTYDLDPPDHQEVFAPKDKSLETLFPGIRRILREAHVRYAFERFGVPYIVSIQCYDTRISSKYLSCREADPIAEAFLKKLAIVGGAPQKIAEPHLDLTRPTAPSDFTYYAPGDLIPNTGWKKMPGRADYHVYALMRFPIAEAPAYVKSQSFMPWGDCYRSGHTGRLGRKDAPYTCKVNGIPLTFNESAAVNFSYPWRDNFCELRDFIVGQCPGGYGHQGQDIRPANCVMDNEGSDRCEPYQHTIAAVRDGLIWRLPGNLAAYLVLNNANEFVRFRYLHMNPKFMDADGLVTGREVKEGEIIGKVATWGDYESGTSYHLHFNMQVVTKSGWVWVNPYMSLVLAYEKLIGGRGTELHEGDPVPAVAAKPPVILHPPIVAAPAAPETKSAAQDAGAVKPEAKAEAAEPKKPLVKRMREKVRKFIRRHRHRKPRTETDE